MKEIVFVTFNNIKTFTERSDIWMTSRCIWSLALVQYFLGIKVPTGFTAALVPPHVLTEVLLPDHTAVHCPLVPHAFVGKSSWGVGRRKAASE